MTGKVMAVGSGLGSPSSGPRLKTRSLLNRATLARISTFPRAGESRNPSLSRLAGVQPVGTWKSTRNTLFDESRNTEKPFGHWGLAGTSSLRTTWCGVTIFSSRR